MNNRLIKSNDAGGGACTNTVDLYNPFPDGGGVALYQLNGDATDVSGNYDGTATNVTYGAGQFGQAGVFNGSSSYIETGIDYSALSEVTYSAWVLIDNTEDNAAILGGVQGSIGNDGSLYVRAFSNRFDYVSSDNNFRRHDLSVSNGWHHFLVTDDKSGNVNMYIDGVEVGFTITATQSYVNNTNIQIGRAMRNTGAIGNYLLGSIDQVRIFSRALRPYEVEALYTEEYCTPTIVPSEHFNTVTYTGTGSPITRTDVGFQPDLVWIKGRDDTWDHFLTNSITNGALRSNKTLAETANPDFLFNSDGFTTPVGGSWTQSGQGYVAWNFKAGGAAVTNTDGTITSQVSANTEAGFSVVSYTGSGANATIGHGLGTAPSMVIVKGRNTTYDWVVYNSNLTATKYLTLNKTDAAKSASSVWNDTEPTNSVFSVGSNLATNQSDDPKIAYCFAEVEGFSSFGSYVGNGVSQSFVLGFEPAFLMIKSTSETGDWFMFDNKRDTTNQITKRLKANTSDAETTSTTMDISFLENGFSLGVPFNDSNREFIYMAFAADPTTIEPSLEDSFNTVLYNGNSSTNAITGVGFQPDFVWAKRRSSAQEHGLYDSVRGVNKQLYSDLTNAEVTRTDGLMSFDSDGFTLGSNGLINSSGTTNVAWAWKGAELPAINSNGSIPSVVSANPAAGFSIVSYTGNGVGGATVGHGLGVEPNMIIVKARSGISGNWIVYDSVNGGTNYMLLNGTAASGADSTPWNNTNPTNTNFTLGNSSNTNSTNPFIAYCFAEVAGFSKFGSYTGNGSASGQTIEVGFEPAFLIIKSSSQISDWYVWDNKRSPTNERDNRLKPNTSDAETISSNGINFDSTSFRMSGTNFNDLNREFIYMAFANQF